jgi:16S rRNA pseudouridine516 synthase
MRPEAITLVREGEVRVDGKVFKNEATQVHENNCVTIRERILTARPSRYIMLHKPLNTICSNVDEGYPSIFRYIDVDRAFDLHVVGRLDVDTTGLVLATDDGRWSYDIIHPKKQCEKVYRVGLRDPISAEAILKLEKGVQLQGVASLTLPAKVHIVSEKEVLLTITEGRFHQVKRMMRAVGNRVVNLHREKIGDVALDIENGKWRHLTADEVASF